MARRLCFLWLILFSVSAWGVNDSLLVEGITQASIMALHNQNDSAIALADSLLSYAEQKKLPITQALLHFIIGTCYSNKKELLTAIHEYMTVMVIADQENFNKKADNNPVIYNIMINTLIQTTAVANDLGWKKQCINCAKAGINWAMRGPKDELMIRSIAVLGNTLTMYKEYDFIYEPIAVH